MTNTITVKPTFLLRGVNSKTLLTEYAEGAFEKPLILPRIQLVNNSVLKSEYSSSMDDPVFSIKDCHNFDCIIATSGHSVYETYTKEGGVLPTGGVCETCGINFTHTIIGYPVAYKERTILVNTGTESKYRVIYTFWVEGIFHSFQCALYYLEHLHNRSITHRDPSIAESDKLLKLLYTLTYPKAGTLKPCNDPRLLKTRGGALSYEEWADNHHFYIKSERVVVMPVKVEYIRKTFDTA